MGKEKEAKDGVEKDTAEEKVKDMQDMGANEEKEAKEAGPFTT